MSIPGNTLSIHPKHSEFLGARGLSFREDEDYEDGGIGLQDPSKGIDGIPWKGWIERNTAEGRDSIYIRNIYIDPILMYEGSDISELSFTFDRNMNVVIAFVEDGVSKLFWYDAGTSSTVITALGSDVRTPKVSHDDKREINSDLSDVILGYIRNNKLYFRQQRDRYSIEYDITADMPEPQKSKALAAISDSAGLVKIGMNGEYRMQFMLRSRVKNVTPALPPPCIVE